MPTSAKGLANLQAAGRPDAAARILDGGGIVADTPAAVTRYHLLALRGALKLESVGLKRSGKSALSIVREHYGVTARTAVKAYPEFVAILQAHGILPAAVASAIE